MTIKEIIQYFGNRTKAAANMTVTEQTIRNWEKSGKVPRIYQLAVQTLSKNKLQADSE